MSAYLSVTETAAALNVSRQRVLVLLRTRRLKGKKVGNTWMVLASSVNAFKALPPGRPKSR